MTLGPTRIASTVVGPRGESLADVARRVGSIGGQAVAATDTDQQVLDKQVSGAATVVAEARTLAQQYSVQDRPRLMGATISHKRDLYFQPRVNDQPLAPNYYGISFGIATARLPAGVAMGGYRTKLTASPTAAYVVSKLWSRSGTSPANDGGGHDGDVLLSNDVFSVESLGLTLDGALCAVDIEVSQHFVPQPNMIYFAEAVLVDASMTPVTMGFPFGRSYAGAGDADLQFTVGYFRQTSGGPWNPISTAVGLAYAWQASAYADQRLETAQRLSGRGRAITFTVGAPEGVLAASLAQLAAGNVVYHKLPVVRAGVVKRAFVYFSAPGVAVLHLDVRMPDGSFQPRHKFDVLSGAPGWVSFDLPPTAVEAGLFLGVEVISGSIPYSKFSDSWTVAGSNAPIYTHAICVAAGLELDGFVDDLARSDQGRKRVTIYDEILGTLPPVGWDTAPGGIAYTANGLQLDPATYGNTDHGWYTQIATNRFIRLDKRIETYDFQALYDGGVIAFCQNGSTTTDLSETGFGNSGTCVDGQASQLQVFNEWYFDPNTTAGTHGAPSPVAVANEAIPFAISAGHNYRAQYRQDGYVHTIQLTDLTTGIVSPVLSVGAVDDGGEVDPAYGLGNSTLRFIFKRGNFLLQRVRIEYDGPQPYAGAWGDSITWSVLVPKTLGWAGLLATEGVAISRSAQPGSSTEGVRRTIESEAAALAVRVAIVPTGTNDVISGVNLGDVKWQLVYIIEHLLRCGSEMIVLARLHPAAGADPSAFNAMVDALDAQYPAVRLWRWDRAWTTNQDSVNIDTTLMAIPAEKIHPNAAGYQAAVARLVLDAPEVFS